MNVVLYIFQLFALHGAKNEANKLNCHHSKNSKSFKDSHSLKLDVHGDCILSQVRL